jgi:hypothetical protein
MYATLVEIQEIQAFIAYPLIFLAIVMVPYTNNPHFVGREDILDQLKARLGDDQEHQKRVALWGLGGVG